MTPRKIRTYEVCNRAHHTIFSHFADLAHAGTVIVPENNPQAIIAYLGQKHGHSLATLEGEVLMAAGQPGSESALHSKPALQPLALTQSQPTVGSKRKHAAAEQVGIWSLLSCIFEAVCITAVTHFATFALAAHVVLAAAHCNDGQLSVLRVYTRSSSLANELHAQGLELALETASTSAAISALKSDLNIAASLSGNGQLIALDSGPPSPLNSWASIPVNGVCDDCPALSDIGADLGEGSLWTLTWVTVGRCIQTCISRAVSWCPLDLCSILLSVKQISAAVPNGVWPIAYFPYQSRLIK